MSLSHLPIIELDSIDSTNNYAMQIIDANKAQHGLTIFAKSQSAGKGQRGKSWIDAPGESLLMSIVIIPRASISHQFLFNASIATAIANVLQKLLPQALVNIKWPNDMIINDKKAGGILIENVLRGSRWTHSVIGLGLNVNQQSLPTSLPYATSLRIASGKDIDMLTLRTEIRDNIMLSAISNSSPEKTMADYNTFLFKRNQLQAFTDGQDKWKAKVCAAHPDGSLEVQLQHGTTTHYHHGQVLWDWEA